MVMDVMVVMNIMIMMMQMLFHFFMSVLHFLYFFLCFTSLFCQFDSTVVLTKSQSKISILILKISNFLEIFIQQLKISLEFFNNLSISKTLLLLIARLLGTIKSL